MRRLIDKAGLRLTSLRRANKARGEEQSLRGVRVCICTPDYLFLVKNGGIGTSFYHTAHILSSFGAEVTILYSSDVSGFTESELKVAKRRIEESGVKLVLLRNVSGLNHGGEISPNDPTVISSFLAYQYIKRANFHIVIFPEWQGLGYYSCYAKREGISLLETQLWVQGHGSSLWSNLGNQAPQYTETDIRLFHFERKSIELSDRFIIATDYLASWMADHAFKMPSKAEVLPLLLSNHLASGQVRAVSTQRPTEIVFFGRLEKRKGLQVYLQAIQRLVRRHAEFIKEHCLTFTFLGKIAKIDGINAIDYIDSHLSGLEVNYTILVSLSSDEAIKYLAERNTLAVMPSLFDNSPMAVHECIAHRIPFIASSVGGIPECLHSDDRGWFLFRPFPHLIADAIIRAVECGPKLARAALDQRNENYPRWVALIKLDVALPTASKESDAGVTVGITHYERPELLRLTLRGLANQTYKGFSVSIVDNGSVTEEAKSMLAAAPLEFPELNVTVRYLPDLYAGAARNLALESCETEYFVVMDDDNYPAPNQIELFVKAISTSGFDALSCAAVVFPDGEGIPPNIPEFLYLYVPAGSGVSANLFGNMYGDANGIFRTSSLRAVGGFTEERSSWEDYEIYSALELAGFKTGVVPEPLMYLRRSKGSVSTSGAMLGNYYRALRPALKMFPWATFGDALLVALNGQLRSFSEMSSSKVEHDEDQRILNNVRHPLVLNRLMLGRRLVRGDQWGAALQAYSLSCTSINLEILELDSALLFLSNGSAKEFAELQSLSSREKTFSRISVEVIRSHGSGSVEGVLSLLLASGATRPLATDEIYILGICYLLGGSPIEALRCWSNMLSDEIQQYKNLYPDIDLVQTSIPIDVALKHYIQLGHSEGRAFAYEQPARHFLGRTSTFTPFEFISRLESICTAETNSSLHLLADLLEDLLLGGSVCALCYTSQKMMYVAERHYLENNIDVDKAVKDGDFDRSGVAHWDRHGRNEGRLHLVGSLPRFGFKGGGLVKGKIYSGLVEPSRSFRGSNVQKWLS